MDFVTFFFVAMIVIIIVAFFGGLFIAALPVMILIGIPLFLLWLLIYHTVIGVILAVPCALILLGKAKS